MSRILTIAQSEFATLVKTKAFIIGIVMMPVLMTGFFFWLMGYRLMAARGYKEGLVPLLVLSVSAALLTAAVEAAWYGLATGIGAWRPLISDLSSE